MYISGISRGEKMQVEHISMRFKYAPHSLYFYLPKACGTIFERAAVKVKLEASKTIPMLDEPSPKLAKYVLAEIQFWPSRHSILPKITALTMRYEGCARLLKIDHID
jgi:hypothetical protein